MMKYDLSPERKPNETLLEYRERRRFGHVWLKKHMQGRQLWDSVLDGIARSAKRSKRRLDNQVSLQDSASMGTDQDGSPSPGTDGSGGLEDVGN